MTTFFRGACASLALGAGVALAGCGGGGGGIPNPTATPVPGTTPTPRPTGTPTPNGSGPITSSQLVFVSTRSGSSEIYKANTDGTSAVQLTTIGKTMGLAIKKPSVSPDGRRIVFQFGIPRTDSGGTNNLEIAVINTDGTGFKQLTNDTTDAGRPDDYNPVFSADNRFIFWTSERGTSNSDRVPHIWRMDGAVGNAAANQGLFIAEPSLSPSVNSTGNTLAYIARDQTSAPIAIQPLSGNALSGTVRRIGSGSGGSIFNLALSPDGSRVAFSGVTGSTAGMSAASMDSATAQINILNVSTGASVGSVPTGGTSNGGSAWSRDSLTLYFDAAGGTNANRQIFSLASPFTGTPKQLTTDAQGANFSPSFLPNG
jgi:Tol biopolymer transport system component